MKDPEKLKAFTWYTIVIALFYLAAYAITLYCEGNSS